MQQEVTVIEGNTFMISDALGDVLPGQTGGFFCDDTRFLSHYELRLNGQRLQWLASRSLEHYSAIFYATNPRLDGLPGNVISLVRRRDVGDGLRDEVVVENYSGRRQQLMLSLLLDADFADIFEAKTGRIAKRGAVTHQARERSLVITYRRDAFVRRTAVTFSQPPTTLQAGEVVFALDLAPGERWQVQVDVLPVRNEAAEDCTCPPDVALRPAQGLAHWLESVPNLVSEDHTLQRAFGRAVRDLAALRFSADGGHQVPAAGLPWFMALFGRDSAITGLEALLIGPDLARGALYTLARYQGREVNDFRDEEPGKILHEIRLGEMATLGETPHAAYYGSVDVTPLFLVLLSETYRWTADDELLTRLLPAADAALSWIDQYGDLDGDGFVEYRRRSPRGLLHQGWKDSVDPIQFADGLQAEGPIALAEVQGYVYDAKVRLSTLYARLGHKERALDLLAQADRLKEQFNQAFWMPAEGYYALALDGRKRPVDSVTSNAGHGLWSGIVDASRAQVLAERLLAPDMFSGWGIRTMSSLMKGYNPLSYHNGSVWPHDNALIAAGLARYGFRKEARQIIGSLLQASSFFWDHRLPELFAGFPRRESHFPVRYPTACSPQAWAAGSVILMLRTLIGAEPKCGGLTLDPLPECPQIDLQGVRVEGQIINVATGSRTWPSE